MSKRRQNSTKILNVESPQNNTSSNWVLFDDSDSNTYPMPYISSRQRRIMGPILFSYDFNFEFGKGLCGASFSWDFRYLLWIKEKILQYNGIPLIFRKKSHSILLPSFSNFAVLLYTNFTQASLLGTFNSLFGRLVWSILGCHFTNPLHFSQHES